MDNNRPVKQIWTTKIKKKRGWGRPKKESTVKEAKVQATDRKYCARLEGRNPTPNGKKITDHLSSISKCTRILEILIPTINLL